jgi:hypothetical protein
MLPATAASTKRLTKRKKQVDDNLERGFNLDQNSDDIGLEGPFRRRQSREVEY